MRLGFIAPPGFKSEPPHSWTRPPTVRGVSAPTRRRNVSEHILQRRFGRLRLVQSGQSRRRRLRRVPAQHDQADDAGPQARRRCRTAFRRSCRTASARRRRYAQPMHTVQTSARAYQTTRVRVRWRHRHDESEGEGGGGHGVAGRERQPAGHDQRIVWPRARPMALSGPMNSCAVEMVSAKTTSDSDRRV